MEMKKVWITGAYGHVGRALSTLLDSREYELFLTGREECDITDKERVEAFMTMTRPDVIINCAAVTDLDECDADQDRAYAVNALGARNLAIEAKDWDAQLIQISTDDVFYGEKKDLYSEFDETFPRTVYGRSKLAGEKLVQSLAGKYTIVRSSWVYGIGRDYVRTVLAAADAGEDIKAATNQISTPTSAAELAQAVISFMDGEFYGVYHVSGKGSCSRYEFAKKILEYSGNAGKINIIPTEEKDGVRPTHSVLNNMMLRLEGIEEPGEWKETLKEYLQKEVLNETRD